MEKVESVARVSGEIARGTMVRKLEETMKEIAEGLELLKGSMIDTYFVQNEPGSDNIQVYLNDTLAYTVKIQWDVEGCL